MSPGLRHLGAQAEQHPDRPAIVMVGSGEVTTYRQLNERSKDVYKRQKYHFMAHHWMHNTETATSALNARKQKRSMTEVFAEHRD